MNKLFAPTRSAWWIGVGAMLFTILLVRTAWCAEDAFIGFRVAQNFIHGHGLVWNVGERVQIYTDPLFEFLLIIGLALTRSDYWSAIVISYLLSILTFFFLLAGRPLRAVALGTVLLLTSKGFVDYSVSGLENPATHLIIALYLFLYWRRRDPLWLTLIASFAAVNRMDSVVLFAPSLLWLYYQRGWRVWKLVLLGALPFLGWEAFSLFYYGFPFPNTAYAKLNLGVSSDLLARQGLHYLQSAISWDTVTPLVISAGIAAGLLFGEVPLALGAILSVVYVVRIGGDYMVGRFLTPAFVFCCAILLERVPRARIQVLAMAGAALLFGILIPSPTLLNGPDFGSTRKSPIYFGFGDVDFRIVDERMYWYPYTGLLLWNANPSWPGHAWHRLGSDAQTAGTRFMDLMPVGMIPYFAGPKVYVYDRGSLGDALTARLKPTDTAHLRPGHYFRDPPPGYMETLQTGVNQIQDKGIAEYYEHLRHIMRGGLWDPSRWREIASMNLGLYDHLLRKYSYPR